MHAETSNTPPLKKMHMAREKEALRLVERGHATIDEIMKASFGEWPPKGLNIIAANKQPVKIVSTIESRKDYWNKYNKKIFLTDERAKKVKDSYYNFLGNCSSSKREIAIDQKSIPLKSVSSILGHEGVHALQHDHSGLHSLEKVFKKKYFDPFMIGYHRDADGNTIGAGRMLLNEAEEIFSRHEIKKNSYINSMVEIQANLHQVLSENYSTWGRLPSDKAELLGALKNAGMTMPQSLLSELEINKGSVRSFHPVANPQSKNYFHAQQKINLAYSHLNPAGQAAFWDKIIPNTYADLIEMYGDDKGRARLGLGENPWRAAKQDMLPQKHSISLANSTFRQESLASKSGVYFGMGYGAMSIYDKLSGETSTYAQDMKAGGARKIAAQIGLGADVYMLGAGAFDYSYHYSGILQSPKVYEAAQRRSANMIKPLVALVGKTSPVLSSPSIGGHAVMAVSLFADMIAAGEAGNIHKLTQLPGQIIGSNIGSEIGAGMTRLIVPRLLPRAGRKLVPGLGLVCGLGGTLLGGFIGEKITEKGFGAVLGSSRL